MLKRKVKKFYTWQPGYGWFGGALKSDYCPTIDACIAFWHILIVERY